MADDGEQLRRLRRLRQERDDALRYAQNASEMLSRCEAALVEERRRNAANRARIAELEARLARRA